MTAGTFDFARSWPWRLSSLALGSLACVSILLPWLTIAYIDSVSGEVTLQETYTGIELDGALRYGLHSLNPLPAGLIGLLGLCAGVGAVLDRRAAPPIFLGLFLAGYVNAAYLPEAVALGYMRPIREPGLFVPVLAAGVWLAAFASIGLTMWIQKRRERITGLVRTADAPQQPPR